MLLVRETLCAILGIIGYILLFLYVLLVLLPCTMLLLKTLYCNTLEFSVISALENVSVASRS